MKWLLVLAANFVAALAIGQTQKNNLLEKLRHTETLMGKTYSSPQQKDVDIPQNNWQKRNYLRTTNRRKTVKILLQDHMPCIVPDMRRFTAMPNALDSSILKNPIDPGIYAGAFKSPQSRVGGKKE